MAAELSSHDFWSLVNENSTAASAHAVSDVRVAFDTDVMKLRSHIVVASGITVVRGSNLAREDLRLTGEQASPLVALQIGLRGSAVTRIAGVKHPFTNGGGRAGLMFTPPGAYEVSLEKGATNETFRVNFAPDYFAALGDRHPDVVRAALDRLASGEIGRSFRPLARLLELADDVMESAVYGSLREAFVEAKVVELLVRYLALPAEDNHRALRPRDVDRMIEARDRLLASLSDPPTLPQLARAVATNEFTLKRDFKAMFGLPVHAFVLERRLERARARLLETDRPIKSIAEEAGYLHLSHFSAAFRKRFGTPPSQLRSRRG
jgi:AraC-like DNA-binding protein